MRSIAYDVYDVFTPTSQATVNYVERGKVSEQVVDALRTPGKQLIVYGEVGSGKSTIVHKKLLEIYEGHIVTHCDSASTFDQLVLDAFDQIGPFYEDARSSGRQSAQSISLLGEYFGIRGALTATRGQKSSSHESRLTPPQLTVQRLAHFLGDRELCWVIEDFQKLRQSEKVRLGEALKMFCDLSTEYRFVKVVAIGAADTARQVVQHEPELAHRVGEIRVPLMSTEEIHQILDGGERLMNIRLGRMKALIAHYSVGVASIAHQLGLTMCVLRGIYAPVKGDAVNFDAADLRGALRTYIADRSDTLKAKFDRALLRQRVRRYDNGRLIISALAAGQLDGMRYSEILAAIRARQPAYPAGNLTRYLRKLQTEEMGRVIRLDADGRYRFVDPFHHLYAYLTMSVTEPPRKLSEIAATHELPDEQQAMFADVLTDDFLHAVTRQVWRSELHSGRRPPRRSA